MLPNFNNNGPCYELFSSATDIIKYWKQKGKILKEFESHTKSYIYSLQFGGVSMLSIPINEKHSLQINNSCFCRSNKDIRDTRLFSAPPHPKDSITNRTFFFVLLFWAFTI